MNRTYVWLLLVAFVAALVGVFVGRVAFPPPVENGVDLHALLHENLELNADQQRRLEVLEERFARRRLQLEARLRADNRRLATAMQAEHRNGPEVSAAIDACHQTMGRLQKETVSHVFAMRELLDEDQAPVFDRAITKGFDRRSAVKPSFENESDQGLVERVLSGDDRAFAHIVGRHKHALYRVAFRITGNEEDALEILQEAFVSAHAALRRYDMDRSLQAWLTSIAVNKARDWRRRETVRRFVRGLMPTFLSATQIPDESVALDRAAAGKQELELVRARIAALPPRLREVIVLRTLEGLSQIETAEILGISTKAVETRLYRARQRLSARSGRD